MDREPLRRLRAQPGAAQFAVRQRVVPPSLCGQVFTTAAGLKVGSFALGAALAGPVVRASARPRRCWSPRPASWSPPRWAWP